MTDEPSGLDAEFTPCSRPPIRIKVRRRSIRSRRLDLLFEDGNRSYTDRIDVTDSKARKSLIRDLKQRWPDLNDDAARVTALLHDLERLAAEESRSQTPHDDTWTDSDHVDEPPKYFVDERGMFWRKSTPDGETEIQLTNFAARIITEVRVDDGVDHQTKFELEMTFHGECKTVLVTIDDFHRMMWHLDILGANAILTAGTGIKDHVREAIQFLSGHIQKRTIFRHLGWCVIDGVPYFLHAGGALGRAGVEVQVEEQLSSFVLPPSPEAARARQSIAISLSLLELAPDTVIFPIFAAIYRSVIPIPSDLSIWVHGRSGAQKSELAALAQQHFGAGMDRTHLPASFSNTANFNEVLAFLAKDHLLVVDDYAPQPGNAFRLQADAERLFRSQGNRSGRGRMTQAAKLTASRPPRGLTLATAEDLPPGVSLRGRLFMVAVSRGDVDLERLTLLQFHAAQGRLAEAMSGFLMWLAPRLDRMKASLSKLLQETRATLRGMGHARSPDQVAHLQFGVDAVLAYAVDLGAIQSHEARNLRARAWDALVGVGRQQAESLVGEDPAIRFIRLLAAVIDSEEGKLTLDPRSPQNPDAAVPSPSEGHIGWRNSEGIYLDFQLALAAVQRLARAQGAELSNTPSTIKRRLYESGFLSQVERSGGRVTHYEPKRTFGLTRKKRLLHLPPDLDLLLEQAGTAGISGTDSVADIPSVTDFGVGDWSAGTQAGTELLPDEGKMSEGARSPMASDAVLESEEAEAADSESEPHLPPFDSPSSDFGMEDPEHPRSNDDTDDRDASEGVAP